MSIVLVLFRFKDCWKKMRLFRDVINYDFAEPFVNLKGTILCRLKLIYSEIKMARAFVRCFAALVCFIYRKKFWKFRFINQCLVFILWKKSKKHALNICLIYNGIYFAILNYCNFSIIEWKIIFIFGIRKSFIDVTNKI